MGQINVTKDQLEYTSHPDGEYWVQLVGFKPQNAKNKVPADSFNLRPQLRITDNQNQELNNKSVLYNLNTQAGFILRDFCHMFGILMDGETPDMAAAGEAGDFSLPGMFTPFDPDDAKKWGPYTGPLLNAKGRIEVVNVPKQRKKADGSGYETVPNETQNDIKRFFCAVPGCAVNHKDNLIR